jgi:hypothetical protein
MTVWEIHRNMDNPGDIGETSAIINDSTFDHNVNQSYGYELQGGIKKFEFLNGVPYGNHVRTGKKIKFNCIHYQGVGAKNLIEGVYQTCQV